jgi:hypothetical protein
VLYFCVIFVCVCLYIWLVYGPVTENKKFIRKKIICLEPVIQRNRFYCVILLESHRK